MSQQALQKTENEAPIYADKLKSSEPLSFADIRRNTQLVQKALKEVMRENVDYGIIQGCGDKPGLFKPGAEKLMFMYKLGCFLEEKNVSADPDVIHYIIKTKIIHLPTGIELGNGVGAASTDEEKYKWRRTVCDEEFDSTPEERKRIKWYKGYKDKPAYAVKQVRTNPADLDNTVLKMAAKRSKVDAVITCTAASDIFNQGEDEIIIDIDESRNPARPQTKPTESVTQDGNPVKERPIAPGFSMIKAKFNGLCKGCGQETKSGQEIAYSKEKGAFHPDCIVA